MSVSVSEPYMPDHGVQQGAREAVVERTKLDVQIGGDTCMDGSKGASPKLSDAHAQGAKEGAAGNFKFMPHSPAQLAAIPSPLPAKLRAQRIFDYDVRQYPFRELVAEVIGADPADLEMLHVDPDRAIAEVASFTRRTDKAHVSPYARRWHAMKVSPERKRFNELLYRFVAEFVAPRMADDDENATVVPEVAFQRDVTFRVHRPSHEAIGELHADADYHHPPAEVNWWLPLTNVWGSNTLQIESAPGKGDFEAVPVRYGQVLRFYGNLLQHHTVSNQTDQCRVSFDFRVLPLSYHDPEWVDRCGRHCIFKVGTYYTRVGSDSASNTRNVDEAQSEDSDCAYDIDLFE